MLSPRNSSAFTEEGAVFKSNAAEADWTRIVRREMFWIWVASSHSIRFFCEERSLLKGQLRRGSCGGAQ